MNFSSMPKSIQRYLWLSAVLLVLRLLLYLFPAEAVVGSQAAALSWPIFLLAILLGAAGVWLVDRWGLPFWREGQRRMGVPLIWGLGFALIFIGIDLLLNFPSGLHVPLPRSIAFYALGAFLVQVFQHLLPFLIVFGLLRWLFPKERYAQAYWTAAILVSLLEPYMQLSAGPLAGREMAFTASMAIALYALNLVEFRGLQKYGYFAMLLIRWGFYLGWHILWGGIIS